MNGDTGLGKGLPTDAASVVCAIRDDDHSRERALVVVCGKTGQRLEETRPIAIRLQLGNGIGLPECVVEVEQRDPGAAADRLDLVADQAFGDIHARLFVGLRW